MAKQPAEPDSPDTMDETEEAPPSKPAAAPASGMLLMIVIGFLVMILTPVITIMVIKFTQPGEKKETPVIESPSEEGVVDVGSILVNIKKHPARVISRPRSTLCKRPAAEG